MNLGRWEIDDFLTFTCNTHDPETGAATDADAVPSYRVYEDETGTPILTGTMALLDSANTAGFYSERIQLTAASGFETGKTYTIYISATVNSTEGTISHSFQVEAALATAADLAVVDANVDAILVDTGTDIPATLATLATAAALATHDGKLDTVDANVDLILADTNELQTDWTDGGRLDLILDGIKAVTDNLPDSGALTSLATQASVDVIDGIVDQILVDTGTDLPAAIAALNDLSSADVQTVLENNDLDHLAKVAHPTGDPVADTLFDYVMNKDGSQTFDRTSDSLEALGESSGATPAQIADAVWDEAIAGHVGAGTFGAKNQNLVPSETITDYRADVSALATQASVDTIDANVDAIKAVTDQLPDGGALTTIDSNIDAILVDTGTDIPATLSTIEGKIDTVDGVVDTILTNLAITDGKVENIELKLPTGYIMGSGTQENYNDEIVAIKTVTDNLPDAGSLNDLAAIKAKTDNLPADPAATSDITALNDLSAADIQTVLENNDLDHLAKVAHPTGTPTADSLFDLIMSKDVGQTFNRATDSLEALRDENYEGPSLADIVDGV